MLTKDFALEVKDVSDEGTFEGYASTFGGAPDSYGDVVVAGAFAKSLAKHKREGTAPFMLWQHQRDQPIGVWEDLAEDGKGLWGKGRLLKGVQKADEAHIILKAKAIRGLSIGYREVEVAQDGAVQYLKEVDLFEISPVTFPAQKRASVTGVKTERTDEFIRRLREGQPPSAKEFEDVLGELGVPKALRTAIASHGYIKAVRGDPEGDSEHVKQTLRDVQALLKNF